MREILFRGQTRRYGEKVRIGDGNSLPSKWVYGGFFPGTGDFSVIYGAEKEDFTGADIEKHTVYSDTVGQYTGLQDKNGKRIFEGDVVVCSQEINGNFIDKYIEIGFVEMSYGAFGLHRKQGYYRPFKDWLEDYEYEVIGNIHDNPELLTGGDAPSQDEKQEKEAERAGLPWYMGLFNPEIFKAAAEKGDSDNG